MEERMDLVDIRANLTSATILDQAKGFSALAKAILARNMEGRQLDNHLEVFFDCFYKYGGIPLELMLESLMSFVPKGAIERNTVMEEFRLRIERVEKIHRALPAVLDATLPSFHGFLSLVEKLNPVDVTKIFAGDYLQNDHYRYIIVLLFTGILNSEQKRIVANKMKFPKLIDFFLRYHPDLCQHEEKKYQNPVQFLRDCPVQDLLMNSLEDVDFVQKLQLMYERPSISRNVNVGYHIMYMPYLYMMRQYNPHVSSWLVGQGYERQFDDLSSQIRESRKHIDFPKPKLDTNDLTFERMISLVIKKQNFYSFWRFLEHYQKELKMFRKPYFLSAIIPVFVHCDNQFVQRNLINFMVKMLKENPAYSESFIHFFIGLINEEYFNLNHGFLLDTITKLATNRELASIVTRFFIIFVQHNEFWKIQCYNLASKLVKEHKHVEQTREMIQLTQDVPIEFFKANLDLAVACCIASDDNDALLGQINACLKEQGERFATTVEAVFELAKNDVLDCERLRKALRKKVKSQGNENAASRYCRILCLGAKEQEDETPESFHKRKQSCIKELVEFTKSRHPLTSSEAWKALKVYTVDEIQEASNIEPSSYGIILSETPNDQLEGIIEFLWQKVEDEKESYSKTLYTLETPAVYVQPLVTDIESCYQSMLKEEQVKKDPSFWAATLPLCAPIIQSMAPTTRINKAIELLKTCLIQVPTGDTREGMLRRMAAWRICVREVFTQMTINSCIMVAREDICKVGKVCLAQKSESVDNVMMMLTVLVDEVEEKIRATEDQIEMFEYARDQRPWVISIFEFVATRLPKEIKDKREIKEKPIYEIMTQSNRSSLHTAIFCLRLLKKHPAIKDFYKNQEVLPDDVLFESLFSSENPDVGPEETPTRKMFWVTTEAYGADELSADGLLCKLHDMIEEKSERINGVPQLTNNESIEDFFRALIQFPRNKMYHIQLENRKTMQKLWKNGNMEVKRQIYEGLSEVVLVTGNRRRKPVADIEKLPDSCVLKGILRQYTGKYQVDPLLLRKSAKIFVNHKRKTDERYLPNFDWLRFLKNSDYYQDRAEMTSTDMIRLACEQREAEVIFNLCHYAIPADLYVIAEHIGTVVKIIPKRTVPVVLGALVWQARYQEESEEEILKIAKSIRSQQKDPIVQEFLKENLLPLAVTSGVTDPILNALWDPNDSRGKISNIFDVWLEMRDGPTADMKKVCDIMGAETTESNKLSMYAIISFECGKLTPAQKISKILDHIAAVRVTKAMNGDVMSVYPAFLAIVVSLNEDVNIPVCFFDHETDVVKLLNAAKMPFFQALLNHRDMRKAAEHIGSFLRPYVEGQEVYERWQRKSAAEMMCALIAKHGSKGLETLTYETDEFWQAILPVE